MYINFITEYIKKLTINDIKNFSKKNNIDLNENELNVVYGIIKKKYSELLNNNTEDIFNELRKNVNESSYTKIIELYDYYKVKYIK